MRPVTEDDVDAILAYRSRCDVVKFLTHPALDRDAVVARVQERMRPPLADARTLTRGLAVEAEGSVIGDAMMRVDLSDRTAGPRVWIGYAFHPDAWGKGYATDTATCLVQAGRAMGLQVWADTIPGNSRSERVLEKAGLRCIGQHVIGSERRNVYANA